MGAEVLSQNFLYLGLAFLPVVYIGEWGNGFFEPKLAAFCVLGAVCLARLSRRSRRGRPLRLSAAAASLAMLAACRIVSAEGVPNAGLALQSIALSVSALAVVLYVDNEGLDVRLAGAMVLLSGLLPLFGVLLMILFRIEGSYYSPFGSSVGAKNSLSVFFAQAVPFLLMLMHDAAAGSRRSFRASSPALFGALTLALYAVFANRTRSAWWMILFYAAALLALYIHRGQRRWLRLFFALASAACLAALLLRSVPNALRWTSRSPYLDSLRTMASLGQSSGRDQLWRVGLRMAADHPLRGVGAGNYPAVWRDYVKETAADPRALSFLRPDLPLFNDFLQTAVENGLPALSFFVLFAVWLPAAALLRLSRADSAATAAETLLCLLCLATSLDAVFDYPFQRPETLLNFAVALGVVSRRVGGPAASSADAPRSWRGVLAAAAVFLVLFTAPFAAGLSLRKIWTKTGTIRALELALSMWPWDCQWGERHLRGFLDAGKEESAQTLVRRKLRAWPNDPESHRLHAALLSRESRFTEAVGAYRRAVVQVAGGRCHRPAYEDYSRMIAAPGFPLSAARLTAVELAPCAPGR